VLLPFWSARARLLTQRDASSPYVMKEPVRPIFSSGGGCELPHRQHAICVCELVLDLAILRSRPVISKAMAACAAKSVINSICLSVKGCMRVRPRLNIPITSSSLTIGTTRAVSEAHARQKNCPTFVMGVRRDKAALSSGCKSHVCELVLDLAIPRRQQQRPEIRRGEERMRVVTSCASG
jgi:hypothetical protein